MACLLLTACGSSGLRMDRRAAEAGLNAFDLPGGEFRLRAYARGDEDRDVLHVYLEGDGRPWTTGGTRVARDPHGDRNVAWQLMSLDPGRSLYLKRPCYQDPSVPPCHPLLWTDARYSELVVSAMESALRHRLAERPAKGIAWIGYSGGGVLAMLLAPRFEQSRAVITVAANLDVAAWADLHGYTPLSTSLDPALQPPLGEHIRQLHLVGENDRNVPPDLIRGALVRQPGVELRVVPDTDHACCWREVWPGTLAELTR